MPLGEAKYQIQSDIKFLPGVNSERARLLARLGIRRGVDLLFHFPRSYEEAIPIQTSAEFAENMRVSFVGRVQELDERVTQSGKHMLGALVFPESGGAVRLMWFNQPFRKNELRPGLRVRATGVLRSTVLNWEIIQPQISLLAEGEQAEDLKPNPVYPLTEGLKQPEMRRIMRETLPLLIDRVEEVLPDSIRTRMDVLEIQTALREIHFPQDPQAISRATRRFKAQELLVLQLAISMQRATREQGAKAPRCDPSGKIHARILNRLGFVLTGDQLAAIADLGKDMSREIPMNRLLQGDVGSGKTVVAQYGMLLCVAHGLQAALMAPTEVLARQHASTLQRSLASSRVRVGLLTGGMPKSERVDLLAKISDGELDLIVGTQALLSDEIKFKHLGLVIVDEQHKFGVLQRAKLRTDESQPHYLVLSATPIPRTIAMTVFGDLDVSTIRQKPPGRASVKTYTAQLTELDSWWRFVDDKLTAGRQAYVIAPRVEETENEDASSALGIFEQLRNHQFAQRTVGLLHGRLSSAEKQDTLTRFAGGAIQLLVATTVVEVGIDVPNATVMTILDANRLGLSQLHQLRGRISRGSHTGFVCAVAAPGADVNDNQRLAAFQKSNDGFELAEIDLRLRGPGDLLGTSQSGIAPLMLADLAEDGALVELAREVARELLANNPQLSGPELEKLRRQTVKRYGQSMQLSDVG